MKTAEEIALELVVVASQLAQTAANLSNKPIVMGTFKPER